MKRLLQRELLVVDLLCGAGGFDEGARLAIRRRRLRMRLLAVNHWDMAIRAHKLNHPKARHLCIDVYKTTPLEAVPGGELDLLMASPTCVHHSRARGGRPTSWDQRKGRMTPTQVYRWLKDLKVRVLLVENVPEFVEWGPICKRKVSCEEHGQVAVAEGDICGKQKKDKKGINFRAWVRRIEALGFKVEWRTLNAADFGDATTRRRFFMIARSDGAPITWPEPSHSADGSGDLFGKPLKRWRPAREVIDWQLKGRSIFDRPKPLAAKTLLRIYAGLIRFNWPVRFVTKLRLYLESLGVEIPVDVVARARSSRARPLVRRADCQGGNGSNVRSDEEPLYTPTTNGGLAVVEPGVLVLRKNADMRSVGAPLPAVMAGGTHLGLVEPFVLAQHFGRAAGSVEVPLGSPVAVERTALVEAFVLNRHGDNNGLGSQRGRSVDEPLPAATASGAGYVVEPFTFPANQSRERIEGFASVEKPLGTIVAKDMRALVEPFVCGNRTNNIPKGTSETPLPTATTTTGGGMFLVEPFMLSQGAGGAPRAVEDPVPTIPTEGAHALIAPYYGASECKSVEEPLGTVTTRDRFGIVTPVTHVDASNRSRSTDEPMPTITGAPRGELAFVTAAFGERVGQAARVRSIEEPVPTLCAKGRVPLVEGLEDLADIDILFRMLEPHELARAMGFPKRYRFPGTKTDKTRMIGNAVAVNVAAALVDAVLGAA